jgi:hypothetical protein
VGFEPKISAGERPKTYALDRAAIGTGKTDLTEALNIVLGMFAEEMTPRGKQILAGVGVCLES